MLRAIEEGNCQLVDDVKADDGDQPAGGKSGAHVCGLMVVTKGMVNRARFKVRRTHHHPSAGQCTPDMCTGKACRADLAVGRGGPALPCLIIPPAESLETSFISTLHP